MNRAELLKVSDWIMHGNQNKLADADPDALLRYMIAAEALAKEFLETYSLCPRCEGEERERPCALCNGTGAIGPNELNPEKTGRESLCDSVASELRDIAARIGPARLREYIIEDWPNI